MTIRDIGAYERGKERRIKMNAHTTRVRKFRAMVEHEPHEFKVWLGIEPVLSAPGPEATEVDWDVFNEASRAASAALRRKLGPLPGFLYEGIVNWGGLTEKMLDCAKRIYAERVAKAAKFEAEDAARKATATPWTAGRHTVTGTVKSARWETSGPSRWASSTVLKGMVVTADGRKLWTTLPAGCYCDLENADDAIKGRTVTFAVTVTPSDDDPTMGFGKRPTVVGSKVTTATEPPMLVEAA